MSEGARRPPSVLVTGLRRSGEYATDPSREILSLLASSPPLGVSCRTLLLPEKPHDALLKAVETMDHFLPDGVLILGLAEGDASLVVDRLAVNGPADPGGGAGPAPPSEFAEPVDAAGPPSYVSTLPVEEMAARMRAAGVPARSGAAGANPMCNRLHYALLHYVALRGRETWFRRSPPSGLVSRVGSITIPPTPEMTKIARRTAPSLPLETSLRGVLLAIGAVADSIAGARDQPQAQPQAQPQPSDDATAEPRPLLD